MKFYIQIFICSLMLSIKVSAQNTPNGSALPTDPLTGLIAYPSDFGGSNGNYSFSGYNYVREYTPLVPVSNLPTFSATNGMSVLVNTAYKDGSGRTLMNITRNNSGNDVITPVDGRLSKTRQRILSYPSSTQSYFKNNVYTEQKNYYLNQADYSQENTTAYSASISSSDQGLPTRKVYSPGKAFVGQQRGTTQTVNINNNSEVPNISPSSDISNYYVKGRVWVKKYEGQHGQTTVEYLNKDNVLIGKKVYAGAGSSTTGWLETYYTYNDFGQVSRIIPPKAAELLSGNPIPNVDKLCYSYSYNKYGQLQSRNVPGKTNAESIIYDRKRRPVLTQSSLQKADNKFSFSIYDSRNRVVLSGVLDNSSYNYTVAQWQTHIDNGNTTIPIVAIWTNGISGSYPSTIANCDIQLINYYDAYDQSPEQRTFDNQFVSFYLTGPSDIVPTPYYFTQGKLIASKEKVVTNSSTAIFPNEWITRVFFYDEEGRVIQTHTKNPWGNWDVDAAQYNFVGQQIFTVSTFQAWSSANKISTTIQYRNTFHPLTGRLESTEQKIDAGLWQPIASYVYDAVGRVKTKWLGGVEKQDYKYNIRGELKSINGDYVSGTTSMPTTVTFAEELSYENGFDTRRYDGLVSGFKWKTASGPTAAYGYTYDNAGRMTQADYRDWSSVSGTTSWNKTNRDYTSSAISFDASGNIKTMTQYGPLANNTYGKIDELDYQYDAGNQLQWVKDKGGVSPLDDYNTTPALEDTPPTYTYDADGNLASDPRKQLTMSYNLFDKPLSISKSGGGTIANIYSANGTLLKKTVTENGTTKNYIYWGPYVYQDNNLQYFLHPEGRSRWIGDSNFFRNDFFIKDHLLNVRNTVTVDVTPLTLHYLATHEIASANIEETMFEHIGEVRDIKPIGEPNDESAAHLVGTDPEKRVGTAIMLQVMAGDKVNVSAYAYHGEKDESDSYAASSAMLSSIMNTLTGGIGGYEGGAEYNGDIFVKTMFTDNNYSNLYEGIKSASTDPQLPRAYLNYLVFNNEMTLVPEQSGAIQVGSGTDVWEQLQIPSELVVGQNGYIAVYISNEQAMDVWFDHVTMTVEHGRLVDEQHYYPYGLLISKNTAAGTLPNKYQYQGNEIQKELGIEAYDFNARGYDQQLGRFTGIDPLGDNGQEMFSPYHFCANNPANFIDPLGLENNAWQFQLETVFVTSNGNTGHYWEYEGVTDFSYFYNADGRTFDGIGVSGPALGGGGGGGGMRIDNMNPLAWNGVSHSSFGPNPNDVKLTLTEAKAMVPAATSINSASGNVQQQDANKWFITYLADATSKGTIIPGGAIDFTTKTGLGRKLATGTAEITEDFARTTNLAKGLTRGLTVLSVATTGIQVANDIQNRQYKSATARAIVAGIIIGSTAIPIAGWGVSLGLSVIEAAYGDDFYEYVEKNW